MKTSVLLFSAWVISFFILSACTGNEKKEDKNIRITIVNSTKDGRDTSFTITNSKDKEEIERIIFKMTNRKVNLNSDQPHNIYVFQFTDDQVDNPAKNVYVVDVHEIMEKFDTALNQTREAIKEAHSELKKVKVDSVIQEIIRNLKEINIAVEKSDIDKMKQDLQSSAEAIKNTRIIVITGENKQDSLKP